MFRRISHRLALQFTGFVFLLLMVTGFVFLVADVGNARRDTQLRLARTAQFVADQTHIDPSILPMVLPPSLRETVRFLDANGNSLYEGAYFSGIPFTPTTGLSHVSMEDELYGVLTMTVQHRGRTQGYVQVADVERLQWKDLPRRALIYLFVSVMISALTYAVGLSFARRSLAPAERMVEQLEQFTQDASHEIRTPLAALNSSLDLALKTKNYKEGIESAKEDVQQLAKLTEHLLELARLDAFTVEKEEVDFSSIITLSVERYRSLAAEKQVEIHASIAPNVNVEGDGSLLRQIIENLLSNAVKYSPNSAEPIVVSLTPEVLKVEDHGVGIAEDALPHIFDRFYQQDTSRAHGGFGLGLSLVKRIADLHGWVISIQSPKEKGTTVTVRFSWRKLGRRVLNQLLRWVGYTGRSSFRVFAERLNDAIGPREGPMEGYRRCSLSTRQRTGDRRGDSSVFL